MIEVKPPNRIKGDSGKIDIFLAGTIEMGNSHDWQADVREMLKDYDVALFNPRRDDWDSSWKQEKTNPQFNEQVTWELEHQEKADLILMHFEPGTVSPITLLELGVFCHSGKLVVHCPNGYARKGNVDITCERYGVRQINHLLEIVPIVRELVKNKS